MVNLRKFILDEFNILDINHPSMKYPAVGAANTSFCGQHTNCNIAYLASQVDAESIIELIKLLLGECPGDEPCVATMSLYRNVYNPNIYYIWICPPHIKLIDELANDNIM